MDSLPVMAKLQRWFLTALNRSAITEYRVTCNYTGVDGPELVSWNVHFSPVVFQSVFEVFEAFTDNAPITFVQLVLFNDKTYNGYSLLNMSALTGAWHICSTPSCTGSMFPSESSISSEWQFTGVSKAGLPSTSWTAATPHQTLPVVSDFDHPAATISSSSYHDIVAARSAVLRRRSDGLECAAWRPPRPVAQCRQFPEEAKNASVSECTWTLSALEALRNTLYKFKTYLLTMRSIKGCHFQWPSILLT